MSQKDIVSRIMEFAKVDPLMGDTVLESLLAEYKNNNITVERERMFRDILVMLAGLKVCTPEKGFKSMDEVRWHIEVALKDRAKVAP